ALRRDGGGGAIHRFPSVEGIRGLLKIFAQAIQIRRAGIPHRNAVGATVFDVEIGGSNRSAEQHFDDGVGGRETVAGFIRWGADWRVVRGARANAAAKELQLLGESE